ncbi:MAG: valS [Parachlamydiales bacterium]|nr:valS [Parachlamydiales bacterium]
MSSLPKAYDPKLVEDKWYSFWESKGFFRADPHSKKKPFCIVIPPPNVTGVLHMGHALGNTLDDILIRTKRMQGFEALWVPGTDHAGIATQTVVERHLYSKTGRRRKDFTREEFLTHVWEWKELSEKKIIQQIKKLGCSCDWSRLCFTMDEQRSRAVRTAFKKLFDQGLIYRGHYLVNWDPVAQTALSDDEVEHEERASSLWYIRYPLKHSDKFLTIATTRPETLLGDVAVAVHPDDERYRSFIGEHVRLPLTDRLIPVIADALVDPKFGTGALKITPAHDFNDYEIAQRHHLPMINIMTMDGKINEQGGQFQGLTMDQAREQVIDALIEMGLLDKIEPHTLRVGVSYRSKAVIQPYLSRQWFVRMSQFKDELLSAVREKRVDLLPPHFQPTYEHWIENLRDWCISRQLWWGHRIPIWYEKENPENIICYDGEDLPPQVQKNPDQWEQDADVLDTWFSSALWPFSVFGWPEHTFDLKKFYPTSILITGHDILFFWVARMILMGEILMKDVPFRETFLHGLIYGKSYWRRSADGSIAYVKPEEKKSFDLGAPLPSDVDSKWEKMSKSKGNVIDPIEIIDEYGTDALRMALCSSATSARQIDLDRRRFEEFKNFANKIWNGARFVFLNLEANQDLPALSGESLGAGLELHLLTLEDRWILSVLNRTIADLNKSLSDYAFDRAATRGYEFFWNDFCAQYVELTKPVLFGKSGTPAMRENKQKILAIILCAAIRLLHPIAPFITEEIFSLLRERFAQIKPSAKVDPYTRDFATALHSDACIVAPYPTVLDESHISSDIESTFEAMIKLVYAVRNIRAEMQLPPSEKTELYLFGPVIREHQDMLLALTPTIAIHYVRNESDLPAFGASAIIGSIKLMVPIPDSFKGKEKARLEKEKDKLEKQRAATMQKLSNEDFRAKAPAEIVQNLVQALNAAEKQLAEIQARLQSL